MNHDIDVELYKDIDIFAYNRKCPICKSKLKYTNFLECFCENNCYEYQTGQIFSDSFSRIDYIIIYDCSFSLPLDEVNSGEAEWAILPIKKEIFYWRENERYVAKILEGQ